MDNNTGNIFYNRNTGAMQMWDGYAWVDYASLQPESGTIAGSNSVSTRVEMNRRQVEDLYGIRFVEPEREVPTGQGLLEQIQGVNHITYTGTPSIREIEDTLRMYERTAIEVVDRQAQTLRGRARNSHIMFEEAGNWNPEAFWYAADSQGFSVMNPKEVPIPTYKGFLDMIKIKEVI